MNRSLEGFTHSQETAINQLGLLGRERDLQVACYGLVGSAGEHSQSVIESKSLLPVTIFTLGRFSILIDGKPAEFGRKFPKRPLELLKAIIAQGGREISISRLTVLLWPDVDGDKATRSFDTTLHRLRKILGDDRVLVLRDGKLSLDACYCWVDVWAFERLLGGSRRLLRNKADGNRVDLLAGLTENLLTL
jgi:hypothetical protein